MLLQTLGVPMLGNMLTGKGVIEERRSCNNMDHMVKKF